MNASPSSDPLSLLGMGMPEDDADTADDPVREQILDAAIAQFSSVGIARSTMGDITRRAGLARMTLYRRFSTKQELVEAALMREAAWFLEELQREVDTHDALEVKLTEGFAFAISRLRDHGLLNRLLETEAESTVPHFTVQGAPLITAAAHFLADLVSRSVHDSRSHEEILVVESPEGEVVAACSVRIRSITADGPSLGEIAVLAVDRHHRGRGLARGLLRSAQDVLERSDTKTAAVFVGEADLPAQEFLAHHGFRRRRAIPTYGVGDDS